MTPVDFDEATDTIAKDQHEYLPLPAHVDRNGREKTMTFCWQLSWRERWQLLINGKLWHQVLTFGHPLQPIKLNTTKPDLVLLDREN